MDKHWHLKTDDEGIGWLHFDFADSGTNVLSAEALDELDAQLAAVAAQHPAGLIIVSDKTTGFIAGADVKEFTRITDAEEAEKHIRHVHGIFSHLEALSFPTVAMIKGFCFGGGLELALACRYRIACTDPGTRLGLPEIRLGLFPGYGGTVRSTRILGPAPALELMLSGRAVDARKARKIGLIDLAVPERQLRAAARQLVLTRPSRRRPAWHQRFLNAAPVRPALAWYLKRQVAAKAPPAHYPAPGALIEHWRGYADRPAAMYANEARQVAHLVTGETARNLIRVFFLQERLKSLGRKQDMESRHVHVIGAGVMGGDIAAWCALQGCRVTLQDRAPKYLSRAMQRAEDLFRRKHRDRRLAQAAADRLMPDHKGYGAARADVVIEAVFEDVETKQRIFAGLEPLVRADTLLASNTSSIPLEVLGESLSNPERLIGLHFFNPVAKMQLVELVKTEHTDPDMLAKGLSFCRCIDRLPLPVKSSPGFLVNRVLMPYLLEAVDMVGEGVPAPLVDKAAVEFGMPMGPIELADSVGLDICLSVAEKLAYKISEGVPERLRQLVDKQRLGRKSGAGFYRYEKGRRVKDKIPKDVSPPPDLTERMIYRLLNECVACLREGVVEDADLLDAGIIFGTGFAPFRGGPMHYANTGGLQKIRSRLDELQRRYGDHFNPDEGWARLGQV